MPSCSPRTANRPWEYAEALDLMDEQIAAERGTIYGVDEHLGDHETKRLQEWRRRLMAKAATT